MIRGGVTIKDGKIIGIPNVPPVPLAKGAESDISIQHPYFWSSFILIGNWL
jgi:CHAT domain-containing protein